MYLLEYLHQEILLSGGRGDHDDGRSGVHDDAHSGALRDGVRGGHDDGLARDDHDDELRDGQQCGGPEEVRGWGKLHGQEEGT